MKMFCLDCETEFLPKDLDICPNCLSSNVEELPDWGDNTHFEGDFRPDYDVED